MTVLRVKDWDKHFESAKSRTYNHRSQFYCPNKHGLGYRRILSAPDGEAIYGCWQSMCQVLSRQELPRQGYLTDTGQSSGRPWGAEDLSLVTSYSVSTCQKMLELCSSQEVGWIDVIESSDTSRIPEGHSKRLQYRYPSPSPLPLPLSTSDALTDIEGQTSGTSKKRKSAKEASPESLLLADRLIESIRSWKPDFGMIQTTKLSGTRQRWAHDIDKMLHIDKRDPGRVRAIIQWLPSHQGAGDFRWRHNILSGSKLREQYDRLDMAMQNNGSKPHKAPTEILTTEQIREMNRADR